MKILELNLGTIRPLQTDSPKYTAGWYVDSQTGQPVYYDQIGRASCRERV